MTKISALLSRASQQIIVDAITSPTAIVTVAEFISVTSCNKQFSTEFNVDVKSRSRLLSYVSAALLGGARNVNFLTSTTSSLFELRDLSPPVQDHYMLTLINQRAFAALKDVGAPGKDQCLQENDQYAAGVQNEVYQQLASKLAHEFSNMLHPALSYTDSALNAVRNRDVAAAEAHLINAIEAQQRVGAVVHKMLYDQNDNGDDLEVITVDDLVQDIYKFCKPRVGARLVVDLKDGVRDLLVNVSRTGFSQVLLNLVGNSFDSAGDMGKIFVLINEYRNGPNHKKSLMIDVVDQGPGFSQEALENAFRLHYTTKAEGDGSGLGLTLARTMIERWGGNIEAANLEKKGALVRVILPIIE